MNLTLINNLVEKYAELSNAKINHFDLISEKGRYLKEKYDSIDFFFERLYDTGNYANFVFTNNSLRVYTFKTFLEELTFPIIAFLKSDSVTPIIIFRPKNKLIYYTFNNEKVFENQVSDIEELIRSLSKVIDLNWRYNFEYGKNILGEQQDVQDNIFFITGIPVAPQLSRNESQNEENSERTNSDASSHKKHPNPVQRLMKLMSLERKEIGYIYFFAVLVGLVNLTLPLGIQSIITLISGGSMMSSIVVLTIIIVAATGFAGYLQILQLQFVEVLQQRVFAKAAYEFSHRIPKIKLEAISKEYGPELVNRFFDVLNIQKSLPKFLIDITAALLQILFGLILLSFYHQFFILFGFLLITIIIVIAYVSGPRGLKSSITESKYKYKVAYWLEELARNNITFKLAGYTNLTIDKTDNYLSNYLIARQKHFKVLRGQYVTIIIFKTFITASLLILGGLLVFQSQINIGQFIAAELIIVLVIASVEKLINTLDVVYDLLTALDKVGHVTDLPLEETKGIKLSAIPNNDNFTIELKNISYKYHGSTKPTLKKINLKFKKGEKICITGQNNSGKTTLIKILTGLYHEYEGLFLYNDISIRDINIYSFRDTIGENITHNELFEGTIEENITVGKKGITLDDLMWAIKEVGLNDFIQNQPRGLKTQLIGGGVDFPSNIKQKFILARSIAEKPSLLVMDDEFFTEQNEKKHLIDVLFQKENEWALVMVTNDPLLLSKADKIFYISNGETTLEGTYDELMSQKEFAQMIIGVVE
ncbi:MAG: ATP-binding cassette domain-containing protein [Bacteroidota bacterium]|nr:ATP-binding cassette domain-containing protein [Bacteroidota bacterium]